MVNLQSVVRGCPALVISECQVGFVGEDDEQIVIPGLADQARRRGIVGRIAALIETFRSADLPVVHSTFVPFPDFHGTGRNSRLMAGLVKNGKLREGEPAADIHPRLAPARSELVTRRIHSLSAFHGTELDMYLRMRGVGTVVFAGISTNVAIPASSVEAVNRGYQVVVVEDCTAGGTEETHAFAVTHTLPLLATVTDSESFTTALAIR
jgi:nicotinamidase-related amidase